MSSEAAQKAFPDEDGLLTEAFREAYDKGAADALEAAAQEDADWTARAWRPEEAETVVKLKKGLLARAKKIREGS